MDSQPPKHADLIFDVGLHRGEDTEFYLKKGFRVVAFEADPDLAAQCRTKFSKAVVDQRLVIIEGAIVETSTHATRSNTVKFYKNLDVTVWGTTDSGWAGRNERLGTRVREIEVALVDFAEVLAIHGIPHYMKIDIEGSDRACLAALQRFHEKPDFLSIESDKKSFARLTDEIEALQQLGYSHFAAVQQGAVERQVSPAQPREGVATPHAFPRGSSGLFGLEVTDHWATAQRTIEKYRRIFLMYRLFGDDSLFSTHKLARRLLRFAERIAGRRIPGWYDTHARLPSTFTQPEGQIGMVVKPSVPTTNDGKVSA